VKRSFLLQQYGVDSSRYGPLSEISHQILRLQISNKIRLDSGAGCSAGKTYEGVFNTPEISFLYSTDFREFRVDPKVGTTTTWAAKSPLTSSQQKHPGTSSQQMTREFADARQRQTSREQTPGARGARQHG
jgi:hypothetical protein